MHVTQRDERILSLLLEQDFVALDTLCEELESSPATVRRDLERLESAGKIQRVRGGARALETINKRLQGTPFDLNLRRNLQKKIAIGRQAATLCKAGEAIIIDGGTTTLQMCPFLKSKNLHVLTNSLPIVEALLQQDVQLTVPGGSIFREQNIILSPFDDDGLKRFHATRYFLSAAAISAKGLMQADTILIQAERKLMARADSLIVMIDSSKFRESAALLLCGLDEIDTVITDSGAMNADLAMLRKAGIKVIVAK